MSAGADGTTTILGAGFKANEFVTVIGIGIGDDGGDKVIAGFNEAHSGAFQITDVLSRVRPMLD